MRCEKPLLFSAFSRNARHWRTIRRDLAISGRPVLATSGARLRELQGGPAAAQWHRCFLTHKTAEGIILLDTAPGIRRPGSRSATVEKKCGERVQHTIQQGIALWLQCRHVFDSLWRSSSSGTRTSRSPVADEDAFSSSASCSRCDTAKAGEIAERERMQDTYRRD